MANNVLTLTKDNFEQEVLQSDKPVLVDFWAPWCGPCRMVSPIVDELANEFDGKIKVGKVNVDEQGELAEKYRIMTIPTLMVFKGGNIVDTVIGARSKEEFSNMLNKHL
ncbi:thioredoxin-1 [Thermoclostridium stercorarium subsp. stercorarium DSM 8532]|uniref:Thioredoxin n=4 Tax=Thermoclostridium stercorarium TaxID=1510 RepID=L7VP29_THES1|nr:thioredoxin [Thermoclostridium stercorarium]AGC68191.1 thioredoxin-1 [Thermoclostridium stercorarium subsp. stercorarium DSM 8532]AGI39218.1 thioredoxin [Thermoclostridium stercorarium subsp. stercorarium DSM 8532]ANW98563.1 thiol reductase thioredoxin [Thermoclostridium stercorarium subsp. thermolacticum DSM 2910]ANX01101.1 thiol reductase thioredoxin [Thermoclostridium stercorarium subsp. leptospartum DSM 9219]UZQ86718.1 thioredoxin [Thermoclostridium stercorarium]